MSDSFRLVHWDIDSPVHSCRVEEGEFRGSSESRTRIRARAYRDGNFQPMLQAKSGFQTDSDPVVCVSVCGRPSESDKCGDIVSP
jgi:hypothetical protein